MRASSRWTAPAIRCRAISPRRSGVYSPNSSPLDRVVAALVDRRLRLLSVLFPAPRGPAALCPRRRHRRPRDRRRARRLRLRGDAGAAVGGVGVRSSRASAADAGGGPPVCAPPAPPPPYPPPPSAPPPFPPS